MQIEQTLIAEKLNHLAAILDDACEGYLTASLYARNREMENFFEKLAYQRKDFAMDIKRLVKSIGAPVYSKGGFLSLLHRTWKDMSYQLKSRDRDAVKTCCVIGEKFASNYYESILNDPQMPEPFKQVLTSQLNSVNLSLQQYEASQVAVLKTCSKPVTIIAKENGEKKLSCLISYLKQVSKDFEMIADEIEDKNLKNVFFALSEEDKQFAEELHNQVGLCGLSLAAYETTLRWDQTQEDSDAYQQVSKQNELMQICDKSEFLFLKLYTDALREFLSFKSLIDMMVYQYNSIRAGFLKLRLLNSLRHNNHPVTI
jgi:uncharacterized protein (TIGR02284 family)